MNLLVRSRDLFVLCLILGCSASNPDGGARSSSGADTVSSNASLVRDTVSSLRKTSVPEKFLESGGFNPDGYYIVREPPTIEGRKIGWLELSTVEVDTTGKVSDERPKLLQPPVGFLTVSEANSVNDSRYPCVVPVISPDSLSVRCMGTPVGEVTINGHFLGKGGDYSDTFAETSTVLLVARVVITKSGKDTHNAVHRFVYNTGD